MNRLAHHQGIHKFFLALGLVLHVSKPAWEHLVHLVDALTTKGFSGTLTDVHHWSFHPNHRTTLSHFFTKSPWNEEKLLGKLQEWILRQIKRLAKRKNQPLFLSIDDTICQKTKPSSRVTHAIQGCNWHYSHKDRQSVWGIRSFGGWCTPSLKRFRSRFVCMTRRREGVKSTWRSRCFPRSKGSGLIQCMCSWIHSIRPKSSSKPA
ncbi:hypothetical protein LR68_01180 [Anoxybacillus sp. BCO1]|nr:hypothetical protein LR68_01180 [Anoxybacillus sp. BCO1]